MLRGGCGGEREGEEYSDDLLTDGSWSHPPARAVDAPRPGAARPSDAGRYVARARDRHGSRGDREGKGGTDATRRGGAGRAAPICPMPTRARV